MTAIAENGGIVGRGVLLDYVRYASKKGISYDPLTNHAISLAEIEDMIHDEKIEIRRGDVLLIRAGLSKWIRESTPESVGPFAVASHMGVDPTPDLLAWIWDQNLAAVGGDAIAFEACQAPDGSCTLSLFTSSVLLTSCQSCAYTRLVYPVGVCR